MPDVVDCWVNCDDDCGVDEMSKFYTWLKRQGRLIANGWSYKNIMGPDGKFVDFKWYKGDAFCIESMLKDMTDKEFFKFLEQCEPDKVDAINHPAYYTDGKIEVSDFIADKNLNFFRGNVVKYVARAGKKNAETEVEDLQKARWYIDREIERLGGK